MGSPTVPWRSRPTRQTATLSSTSVSTASPNQICATAYRCVQNNLGALKSDSKFCCIHRLRITSDCTWVGGRGGHPSQKFAHRVIAAREETDHAVQFCLRQLRQCLGLLRLSRPACKTSRTPAGRIPLTLPLSNGVSLTRKSKQQTISCTYEVKRRGWFSESKFECSLVIGKIFGPAALPVFGNNSPL